VSVAEALFVLDDVAIDRPVLREGRPITSRVLEQVSLTVPAGGRLALYGPSGSGKSSLLRLFNRLDDPSAGRVLFAGTDLRDYDPIILRRRVGMLFQQPHLFDVTVGENLAYPLRWQQQTLTREDGVALLCEVGLPEDFYGRRAQQLSGGQQQRVALARALALSPTALLLDEPTSALDEESAHLIVDLLLRRNVETGMTLITVTHARHVLERLNCPTALVDAGRVALFPDAASALASDVRGGMVLEES
jgi:putative ABC transport system ATP-binding protein